MQGICDQAAARWDLSKMALAHRTGTCAVGEPSVMIAASSPHRRDALEVRTRVTSTSSVEGKCFAARDKYTFQVMLGYFRLFILTVDFQLLRVFKRISQSHGACDAGPSLSS